MERNDLSISNLRTLPRVTPRVPLGMNERIELVPCDSDRVGSRCGLNQMTRDDSFARVTINSFSASKFVFFERCVFSSAIRRITRKKTARMHETVTNILQLYESD